MRRIHAEYFIARRLSRAKRTTKSDLMVRVTTLCVAVSIAVMIVAMAVISGFKRTISEKVMGLMSPIQIVNFDNNISWQTKPIDADQPFLKALRAKPYVTGLNAFALKPGVMKQGEEMTGTVLRGVDSLYDWQFMQKQLVEGRIPQVSAPEKRKEVLISKKIADRLKLHVGDKAEMLFIENPPRRDRYEVAGIYNSSLSEIDDILVMTDIRNVQRLNGWSAGEVTGFEVYIDDYRKLDALRDSTDEVLYSFMEAGTLEPDAVLVTDVTDKYGDIFEWLKLQDMNELIIMAIMLIVASINMVAMMLIILLQNRPMVQLLLALGMRVGAIQKIFLYRGGYILLKGMLYGNIAGIGLALLQKGTGLLKLDQEGYFLDRVPIHLDIPDILLLNAGAFAVMILVQIIPTRLVRKKL